MSADHNANMAEHGAPIERDGTAIDWDSECIPTPGDEFLADLRWLACAALVGCAAFGAASALLVVGLP